MTPAEEDALIAAGYKAIEGAHYCELVTVINDALRTAIREAVAHERERCAKVADKHAERDFTWGSENSDRYHAQADWAASIAAAIRRGE